MHCVTVVCGAPLNHKPDLHPVMGMAGGQLAHTAETMLREIPLLEKKSFKSFLR